MYLQWNKVFKILKSYIFYIKCCSPILMYYCVSYLIFVGLIISFSMLILYYDASHLVFISIQMSLLCLPSILTDLIKTLLQILCYIIFWNWSKIFVCLSCPRYKNIRYNKNQYLNLYWMVCWGWDWVEYKKLLHYKYNDLISISNSDTCMVSNTRES